MTNNRWIAACLSVLALAAVGTCLWQIRQRNAAKQARDEAERLTADAIAQLRGITQRSEAQKAASRNTTAEPAPKTATSGSDDSVKIALQAKRQAAAGEALLHQRVRRLMSLEMKLRPKFHALGLSDAQWEHYEVLSLEKISLEDEMRREGRAGKSREDFEAAVRDAGAETVDKIKALIGAPAYEELLRFQAERSDPVRLTINGLSARLLFSDTPLEAWQAEKLAQLLRFPSPNISAGSVLTKEQLWALKQIQTENQSNAATTPRVQSPDSPPPR